MSIFQCWVSVDIMDGFSDQQGDGCMDRQLWLRMAILILTLIPVSSLGQSPTPCLFDPSGGDIDDSQALAALLRACRWVQINGPHIRIDQPIELVDEAGGPLHFATVEPAPGLSKVTVHTAIESDPNNITNPSRSSFDYHGNFEVGSYLRQATIVGQSFIIVHDPAALSTRPFAVGDYVYINDTSTQPEKTLLVQDGALEVRQVVTSAAGIFPGTIRLDFDRPLNRQHAVKTIAAHCQPINYVRFSNLEFTTDYDPQAQVNPRPRAGIHLHMAYRATINNIKSSKWAGAAMIVLDTGGRENTLRDVYATGASLFYAPNGNIWGVALEGQEDSTLWNCGAEGFLEGIVINYSYNTVAFYSTVRSVNVALRVHSDINDNGSIKSGFIGGLVTGAAIGAAVGRYCQECIVSADITADLGIWIFQFARKTTIGGKISNFSTFGIGFDLVNGGIADGTLTSRETFIAASIRCRGTNRLALTKGGKSRPYPRALQQFPWLILGAAFNQCP